MIKTFFALDTESADRAKKSQVDKRPDTFSGVDLLDGQVKLYTGIVRSVADSGVASL